MNSKQLAQLLDQVSAILKSLPNMELSTALSVILQNLQITTTSSHQADVTSPQGSLTPSFTPAPIAEDLTAQIDRVPSEQLDSFIRSSPAWKTKASLQQLAAQFGISIPISKTKEAMLTQLITHIEFRRSQALIRNYQLDHSTL